MAFAKFTSRGHGSVSCSIQSEQDLVVRDEANFCATQALKEHEHELLKLDSERVRAYLFEKNLLKDNEIRTLKDGNNSKREKMKYVLHETNCTKGERGLAHVVGLLLSFGDPAHAELANVIQSSFDKRMEEIRRQYPQSELDNLVLTRPVDEPVKKVVQQRCRPVAVVTAHEQVVPIKLKIIALGNHDVGKTSFLIRYCTGRFSNLEKKPAIANDWINKVIEHNQHWYDLQFWDTHGMEQHNSIPSVYYRDAVGILLVYDVTKRQSIESLKQWWSHACTIIMMKSGKPIPAVLLANKCDLGQLDGGGLRDDLQVCGQYNTSAKTGEGVSDAVTCLLEKIIDEGLLEEPTECWTEIPDNISVKMEHLQMDQMPPAQPRRICPC